MYIVINYFIHKIYMFYLLILIKLLVFKQIGVYIILFLTISFKLAWKRVTLLVKKTNKINKI